jgi:UDP-N-acetylglucosamine acyltransferase
MSIHPTAVVDPQAEVDPSVEIGPYSVVGPHVRLAAGVVLHPHSYVTGYTEIGPETHVFSFAAVGEIPQDKKYRGEPTRLVIGARNRIREHVTLHPGTAGGGGLTTVGDDNLLMIGTHVAHDCHIGSHVIMANNVGLAGHVRIEDHAVLGAFTGVHQFVRFGRYAMTAAMSAVSLDIPPFALAAGDRAHLVGLNKVNLERNGFSSERIEALERAFRIIFRSGQRARQAFSQVREELAGSTDAEQLVAFLEKSERGFCRVR